MATFQKIVGGFKMPSFGLGTFTATDEAVLEKALDVALEAGYRHIDTAYAYTNEPVIGRVLKRWFDAGKLKREDIFITTKLPPTGNSAERVEFFLKKSLANLQLQYVDLYLIHFPVGFQYSETPGPRVPVPTDHLSIWKAMEEQVDAGRTRAIGISNFNVRQTKRIYENSRIKPAVNQFEVHPYFQQKKLVGYCQEHNIVVTGYASLGRAGVNDYYKKVGMPVVKLPLLLEDPEIKKIADKHQKSTAQVILRFFIQKNIIMIPKSTTPARIKHNIDIFDFALDADDMSAIVSLDKGEAGRINPFSESSSHPENPLNE